MSQDPALIWDQQRSTRPRPATGREPSERADAAVEPAPDLDGRIDLREASRRFGVSASTLGAWARAGSIDGVKAASSGGPKWMVTPESIAHHLAARAPERPDPPPGRTAPTPDGAAMLVPRDAWDRLMEQLGNLHEAGLHLAEARERAARAETEAEFLRERLSEMRSERDTLRERAETPEQTPRRSTDTAWDQVVRWLRGTRR
jgi:DNA-binding transcriptional MerR regulator